MPILRYIANITPAYLQCSRCDGYGGWYINADTGSTTIYTKWVSCLDCHGTGVIPVKNSVDIAIPPCALGTLV